LAVDLVAVDLVAVDLVAVAAVAFPAADFPEPVFLAAAFLTVPPAFVGVIASSSRILLPSHCAPRTAPLEGPNVPFTG
jgi:hypothetical protein